MLSIPLLNDFKAGRAMFVIYFRKLVELIGPVIELFVKVGKSLYKKQRNKSSIGFVYGNSDFNVNSSSVAVPFP